jgi:hypothetical protein
MAVPSPETDVSELEKTGAEGPPGTVLPTVIEPFESVELLVALSEYGPVDEDLVGVVG